MPFKASDNFNALGPDASPDTKSAIYHDETPPTRRSSIHPELAPDVPLFIQRMSAEERYEKERKLVRKIDLRLLPMLVLMYIMNYLDRNNIASAKLAGKVGMLKELHLTSTQYNVSLPR